MGDECAVKHKIHKTPKRHAMYSLAARTESSCTLLGEISSVRAVEKSAEVVVVKIASERRKERRTEEQPREQPNHNLRKKSRHEWRYPKHKDATTTVAILRGEL